MKSLAVNRWVAGAGLVYVAAWVAGLLVAPGAPTPTASAAEVSAYYLTHRTEMMLQTYLLTGVAGAALLMFSAALVKWFQRNDADHTHLGALLYAAGVVTACLSFVQGAFGEVLSMAPTDVWTQLLFELVNVVDTFKLLALGLFVGATSMLAQRTVAFPRWVNVLGIALAPALVVGGSSFLVRHVALSALLYLALPALLIWVAAVSVVTLRKRV